MDLTLGPLPWFHGRPGPLLLVIADGMGLAPPGPANAIHLARTPNLDRLLAGPLVTRLKAHGTAVGMPGDGDMGNSEVGHNTLGAGRVFAQGAALVNEALASGRLFEGEVWQAIEERGREGGAVHLIGLLSDGNVHSHIDHLLALLARLAGAGVGRARVHVLTDGRDVDARSALGYIERLDSALTAIRAQHDADYRIASGGGRMRITMDRYEADWDMVARGWETHVHGHGRPFASAAEAVATMYAEDSEVDDQTLEPFVVVDGDGGPLGPIVDGDAVVFFNFRGDRAIEISRAFEEEAFDAFERGRRPEVLFAGMLEYDGDLHVPKRYLVAPPLIERTVGQYLCAAGVRSFAISETQKFGHVTYFWNGNRSGYIDRALETYVEIPSERVPFDRAPAMKAAEITDRVETLLREGGHRFGRLNFANGDMVGHTGRLEAAVAAVETVDACLGRLMAAIDEIGGVLVYTADHGNVEEMFVERDGGRVVRTAHTLNPVPFVIHDPAWTGEYSLAKIDAPGLANVAATLLNLLGFAAPDGFEPSLIGPAGARS